MHRSPSLGSGCRTSTAWSWRSRKGVRGRPRGAARTHCGRERGSTGVSFFGGFPPDQRFRVPLQVIRQGPDGAGKGLRLLERAADLVPYVGALGGQVLHLQEGFPALVERAAGGIEGRKEA